MRRAYVRMAANEWGNPLMTEIAGKLLAEFDMVYVQEHAGWWIEFITADDGRPASLWSANCATQNQKLLERGRMIERAIDSTTYIDR